MVISKKTVDRAVLIGLILLAVLLFSSTSEYKGIAQKTSAKYVQFLAVSLGLLSAIQLTYSLWKDRSQTRFVLSGNPLRFAILIVAMILFAMAFEAVGFFIPAAIFIPCIAVALGYTRAIPIILTTIAILAFVYLVFVQLLAVNLPGISF